LDMDRSQAKSEHMRRLLTRIPLQVNQNIYAIGMDARGCVVIIDPDQVGKPVECRYKPPAHFAAIIPSVRISTYFETRPIMALDQLSEQVSDRVLLKIL